MAQLLVDVAVVFEGLFGALVTPWLVGGAARADGVGTVGEQALDGLGWLFGIGVGGDVVGGCAVGS